MTKNKYTNLLLQTLGCFISAAGIYSFAVAAEVPVTGIAGICAILYRLFGIPMGLSNVLINIPIILCTYKLLGRSFFIRSVYCMVLFAIFTDYLLPLMPVYQGDRLLATICGSVVGGIGDALIYMNNSSTGGLDFITMGIKARHPHLPFGNITFAAALAVILLNGAVFQDVDSIIYGIMFNFIVSAVINKMMFGFSSSMLAMIVTDDARPPARKLTAWQTAARRFCRVTGLRRPAEGRRALCLLQQAALRDRARRAGHRPRLLHHHAAIQRGPRRGLPAAGVGEEREPERINFSENAFRFSNSMEHRLPK